MNPVLRTLTLASVTFAATVTSALPFACSAEGETSGKRVAFDVVVTGSPASRAAFTNAKGWSVLLDEALVATGPLTFYDGATIFSRARSRQGGGVLGVRSALAHPGHYAPGGAKGELLAPWSADLRGETSLGRGAGVSGMFRSATFSFGAPAAGPLAGELGASVAVLEGTATKGAARRVFRAEIGEADVRGPSGRPEIEGCAFVEADVQGDGRVTLTVKVELWLDQVDFADVPESADGRPVTLAGASVARSQLVRGMKAGTPYVFAFTSR